MKVLSAAEMQVCDHATTERFGVPSLDLMRAAARAVASFVTEQFPAARRVTALCGRGNNGGDGMMVAQLLSEAEIAVTVLLLGAPDGLKGDAAIAWQELTASQNCATRIVHTAEELAQHTDLLIADVIVDAVVGTGFEPPLRGLALAVLEWLRASDAVTHAKIVAPKILAIDLPSGWAADACEPQPSESVFPADAVITFTAPKPAHVFGQLTRHWEQPVVVALIGSPEEAIVSSLNLEWAGAAVDRVQQPRAEAANKGNFGHVLVIGGSVGRSGAPSMTSLGALRSGAGLVTAAVPAPTLPLVAVVVPELMTIPLAATAEGQIAAENLDRLATLLAGKTVLAMGPGIGQSAETARFVLELLRATKILAVVDADGLNILATAEAAEPGTIARLAEGRTLVLTPHPGEMARLDATSIANIQSARLDRARSFAKKHGVIVVLKGARTVIASPDGRAAVNTSGNPGMAKGGSGDMLTGLVAGLLAQDVGPKKNAMETVAAAVWLHGLAADFAVRAGDEHTLLATDVLPYFSQAFRYRTRGRNGYRWLQGMRD